ncbi:DNA replication and repair protein RecF [Fulvivirga sp. 29W222]|uniref:DNA replication and repair protein RecF n=1 Tax=Fulvivirga marina TaxID=2494733 RepID=A0A937FVT4_9BACT|nr:DNA replication and repair protein RecF [Fulvivirga marina]MBL6446889.1 DNA replication and repair protein RecF [Fulvivirga marina]
MHIEKLSLFNFKNYEEITLNFSEKVNCLVGVNGTGKTNILDAIHYLSLTKSAFNSIDSQNIRFGEKVFSIRAVFSKEGKHSEVSCGFQEGTKKAFRIDRKEYERLSEHIGKFPVVLIAPNDVDVIREGSEIRRKFFDAILCQMDNQYLDNLVKYNQYLRQRNSALKKFTFTGRVDYDLIHTYDRSLLAFGKSIFERRSEFIKDYFLLFQRHYSLLSQNKESVTIIYKSEVGDEAFEENFNLNLKKDLALERTSMGVHRDDYKLMIEGKPLKKFGSQGQQKTFLVALKMAHFEIIKGLKGFKPILLLDDIFDKLDSFRIKQLVRMIADQTFGQIFITDAREERTKEILKELNIDATFYQIDKGIVKEATHGEEKI